MAADISPPSSVKKFPGIINLQHPSNSLADLTYFLDSLPSDILEHRSLQGYSFKKWKHLQYQIHSTSSPFLYAQCLEGEILFFNALLQQSSKIKQILIDQGILTLQIDHAPAQKPISSSPFYDEENTIHEESIRSHSLHFLPPDTTRYPIAFQRMLQQIYETIKAGKPDLFVYLYGVDCLFFAYILRKSYRFCIQAVFLHASYTLHLYIKRNEDRASLLATLKEEIQEIQSKLPHDSESLDALSVKKEKIFDALSEKNMAPENFLFSPSEALKLFELPLHEIEGQENRTKNHAYCLASTYLAYCLHQLKHNKILSKLEWETLWGQVDEYLPAYALYQDKKTKKEIQKLALLKRVLERKKFPPIEEANSEQLKKTSLYEVKLSYFREGSTEALNSIWINQHLLQVDAAENSNRDLPLIYSTSLIRSLAHSQGFLDFDALSFAQILKSFKEGDSIDRENPANDIVLLMLQAGSFPFFLHAHRTVVQKITVRLQKKYRIKYTKPQRNVACEFFVAEPGHFTMIRTSTYLIQKEIGKEELEIKGEFVMKWTVSLCSGHWTFSIQFPAFHLNSTCSPEEQMEIYKGFE